MSLNRRSFVKAAGAAGAATAFTGSAGAVPGISDALDVDGGLQETLVVFRERDDRSLLDAFDLLEGRYDYEELPVTWTHLDGDQIATVAEDDRVLHVSDAFELDYYNDAESREAMSVTEEWNADELGYQGEGYDAVVIDSGIDGSHPDFSGRVESNYEYVDEPLGDRDPEMWVDIGPGDSDEIGHGQHCCGIVAGDGAQSSGQYQGMAPKARLSVYSVSQAIYLPYAVGAWDHMIARKKDDSVDFDPVVCSNSYGVARGNAYNPLDPLNVATWEAFNAGILPVFAAGNDGPGDGTISRYAKAPHVLAVGAGTKEKSLTGFSSRGRPDGNHDRKTAYGNLSSYMDRVFAGRVITSDGTLSGTVGPGVDGSAVGGPGASSGSSTHELRVPDNADLLEGSLSLQPGGQQVQVSFYQDRDGDGEQELVARMGEEPVYIHKDIAVDLDGGEPLRVEFTPKNAAAAQYEFSYTLFETRDDGDADLDERRPVSLFRPGIVTHGNSVMSTFDPEDALRPPTSTEPFYGRISGTSMACPAAAGIAVLVVQAAEDVGLEYAGQAEVESTVNTADFGPLSVINTLEATTETNADADYTPHDAGAGWVDAEAAVEAAKQGLSSFDDVTLASESTPPPVVDLSVQGTRTSDGTTFTGGQTDQVKLTVDSVPTKGVSEVQVIDRIPSDWDVKEEFSDGVETVEETDSGQEVHFTGSVAVGDSVSYFVEAPSGPQATGSYTFGSAKASTPEGVDLTGSEETTFGGTKRKVVVGVGTNA
ncbi:S8 family serine peptidase [Halorarius halobius]|uniref:S8 family serine peptidase n=1 Tax=Halorarius halobius TaxID=2962671 RepID=UPI0020CF4272|nr:S8 family serine peptidase [Halorarius halobius]